MNGAGFLVVWGIGATVMGTVYAGNVAGIVDKLLANAARTKLMAGRPHGWHPFTPMMVRAFGGIFAVIGCVVFGVGITHL